MLYSRYKQLQNQLQAALIQESNDHWSKLMTETAATYSYPAVFWRKIKNLQGNNITDPHYLLDNHNTKVYSATRKEQLHRQIWQSIFTEEIKEDEDKKAVTNEETVNIFLANNIHITTPHHTSNLLRLSQNYTISETTSQEISTIIKHMMKTCPGSSEIDKTILSHLPIESVTQLKSIFNATVSAGYFPDR